MRAAIVNAISPHNGCDNCHTVGALLIINACIGRELILCCKCAEQAEIAIDEAMNRCFQCDAPTFVSEGPCEECLK